MCMCVYVYVYVYVCVCVYNMCVCVCVCVCAEQGKDLLWPKRQTGKKNKKTVHLLGPNSGLDHLALTF
jgi:hypothetical protein